MPKTDRARREARGEARGEVIVIGDNPETLDALHEYLRGCGIVTRCTSDLSGWKKLHSRQTTAIVFFPDAYELEGVRAVLVEIAAIDPQVRSVVVTAHPQRHRTAPGGGPFLILPRPVWGWTILDAIRGEARQP